VKEKVHIHSVLKSHASVNTS